MEYESRLIELEANLKSAELNVKDTFAFADKNYVKAYNEYGFWFIHGKLICEATNKANKH